MSGADLTLKNADGFNPGDVVELLAPKTHNLEFRSANQHYDSATGELVPEGVVVTAKAMPKEGDIGKLEPASNTDSSNTMEVTYLKVEINNKKKIEIDKCPNCEGKFKQSRSGSSVVVCLNCKKKYKYKKSKK